MTKDDLLAGMADMGLEKGMAIEVHCSLGKIGPVFGGAETVIEALIGSVGPAGAIVMPSFRMSRQLPLSEKDVEMGLTCKIKILEEDSDEPSGMGIIADTFRRRNDVKTGQGIYRDALMSDPFGLYGIKD